MERVYTAQYRYGGPDRLDITVKGQDPVGRVFAPTWDMVMGLKRGNITQQEYSKAYLALLSNSYCDNLHEWTLAWRRPEVTLVCFCPPQSFCHRYILAELFRNMGASYGGERSV